MKLRVIDFDLLTRSFQPYVDGALEIEKEKKEMIESVSPQRKEMESIIKSHTSGIIIDEISQKANIERVRQIQDELMKKDQEFKFRIKELRDNLNTSVYDQLSTIITDWSKENGVDLTMGKMEVVYSSDELDATNHIIEILKQKNLFYQSQKQEAQAS